MGELSGLRALVTGGSSGIGAAIAKQLADRGADLVLTARRKDALAEVAAACAGARVDVVTGDLGKDFGPDAVWTAATAGGRQVMWKARSPRARLRYRPRAGQCRAGALRR